MEKQSVFWIRWGTRIHLSAFSTYCLLYLSPASPSHLISMDDTAFPPSIPMAAPTPATCCAISLQMLPRLPLLEQRKEGCDGLIARRDVRSERNGRASIHAGVFTTLRGVPLTAPNWCVDTTADATANGAKWNWDLTCRVSGARATPSHPIAKGFHLKFDIRNVKLCSLSPQTSSQALNEFL